MGDQNQSDPLSSVLKLLGFIGSPIGIGLLVFITTHNLWYALGLAVVFLCFMIFMSLVSGWWKGVVPPIIQGAVEDTLRPMERRRAGYGKYDELYRQHLIYRHRTFDVKGFTTQGPYSLELERIFVDLKIIPEARPLAQLVPADLREGGHFIWDYLRNKQIRNLAIIGAPGCGKTTLLRHITLSMAAHEKKALPESFRKTLPILLFLRDHAKTIAENPETKLVTLIHTSLTAMPEQPPAGWFEERLKKECLIMLDGLDEVADPDVRRKVVSWVETQMQAYGHNCFIVTSRPHGYRTNPLSGVIQLEVRPFNQVQIEKFVWNWYLANEIMSYQKHDPGVEMVAREGAQDLIRRIRTKPDIAELAVNPLLLTMIATVHRYSSFLPGRRVDLYAEMCEVMLGKRDDIRDLTSGLSPSQKQSILQPLAYAMMVKEQREMPLDEILSLIVEPLGQVAPDMSGLEFLKLIEGRSGILLERENGIYSFSHKTFQEFLTASHIEKAKLEANLLCYICNDWWHETIQLYCARNDATSIITACLSSTPLSIPVLVLAIECAQDALKVQPVIRQQLEAVLEQDIESADDERRHVATEALMSLRLRRLIQINDDCYADSSCISCAEYQLFLDEQIESQEYIPHHWSTERFTCNTAKHSITGVTPEQAQAFCDWLTGREPDRRWIYRLPTVGELDEIHSAYWILSEERAVLAEGKEVITLPFGSWILETNGELTNIQLRRRQVSLASYHPKHHLGDSYIWNIVRSDLVLSGASALVGASASASASIRTSASARALTSARSLVSTLPSTVGSVSARDLVFDLTGDIAFDLSRDLAFALDRDLTRALANDFTCYSNGELLHANTLALAHALALAYNTSANALALARASALARDLARDLTFLISLSQQLTTIFKEMADIIADYSLLSLLTSFNSTESLIPVLKQNDGLTAIRQQILNTAQAYYENQPRRARFGDNSEWDTWDKNLNDLLCAYAMLAMLERRRTGEWKAFEGIRIVKERRERSQLNR